VVTAHIKGHSELRDLYHSHFKSFMEMAYLGIVNKYITLLSHKAKRDAKYYEAQAYAFMSANRYSSHKKLIFIWRTIVFKPRCSEWRCGSSSWLVLIIIKNAMMRIVGTTPSINPSSSKLDCPKRWIRDWNYQHNLRYHVDQAPEESEEAEVHLLLDSRFLNRRPTKLGELIRAADGLFGCANDSILS